MRVSVVIPALNEAGNIGRLVEETYAVVPSDLLAEVIVVDDCSTDADRRRDQDADRARDPSEPALPAPRHALRPECRRCAPASSPPPAPSSPPWTATARTTRATLPRLIERLAPPGGKGPALVGGIRTERKAEGSKRLASRAANWIRDRVLDDDCPDTGCGIKVFWREAFLRLPYFSGMHRYLPALFLTYGYEVAYVPVNDRARIAGRSKYSNLGRALLGLHDLVGVSWLRKRTKVPVDRRGPAGRPSGVRSGEPFQPARRCRTARRRQDLSARACSRFLGAAWLAMDRRLQFAPCTRVCVRI